MGEEMFVEKISREIQVAGANNLCEVSNFTFELKEKKLLQFKREETQSQTVTLRVWLNGQFYDVVVPRLAEPFVGEACEKALARLREDPNLPKTLQGFRRVFEEAIARIFHERFLRVRIFDGKKPTKIRLAFIPGFCGHKVEFEIRISTVHGDERTIWSKWMGWDFERAKKTFDLLVSFCESVGRPRVFQVRNFAKKLVEKKPGDLAA